MASTEVILCYTDTEKKWLGITGVVFTQDVLCVLFLLRNSVRMVGRTLT